MDSQRDVTVVFTPILDPTTYSSRSRSRSSTKNTAYQFATNKSFYLWTRRTDCNCVVSLRSSFIYQFDMWIPGNVFSHRTSLLRLCPTLPSRRFRLPPSKYFLQTVLGLCYSFLSWFTYVSRRWQTVLDVLNFAVVQSLKRPASDRDWRFSHVTLAFVWRFHRYSCGTLPVSILSLLLGRRTARVK